jgi:hypothetical protein
VLALRERLSFGLAGSARAAVAVVALMAASFARAAAGNASAPVQTDAARTAIANDLSILVIALCGRAADI